jgi:hypothetical protein
MHPGLKKSLLRGRSERDWLLAQEYPGKARIPATRFDLDRWMKTLPQPWTAAMEATIFTGWIYDHLKPHAAALKVAEGRTGVRATFVLVTFEKSDCSGKPNCRF